MPLIERDQGLGELVDTTDAERIATDCAFTEGPLWLPEGALLFSDIPRARIHRWTRADGLTIFREPSGQSNGLTLDLQGRLLACEHGNRRVSRTAADGTVATLVDSYDGKQLNSPNDIVVHSDGAIYFTDPPYGIKPEQQEQPCNGVYRLSPDGTLTRLVEDFDRPNGLAFSPDERTLYIDDTNRMHVRAFDVAADGTLANDRIFATFDPLKRHGADGLKVDHDGRVYVTGGGGLFVWSDDGYPLGIITLPENPANVGWGDAGHNVLYLTAQKSVYRVPMKVAGLAPGPRG